MKIRQFTLWLVGVLVISCALPVEAITLKGRAARIRTSVGRKISTAASKFKPSSKTSATSGAVRNSTTRKTIESTSGHTTGYKAPTSRPGTTPHPTMNLGGTRTSALTGNSEIVPNLIKKSHDSWAKEAIDIYRLDAQDNRALAQGRGFNPNQPIAGRPIWQEEWQEVSLRAEDFFPQEVFKSQEEFLNYLVTRHNQFYIETVDRHLPKVLADLQKHAADFEQEAKGLTTFNHVKPGGVSVEQQAAEMIPTGTDNVFIAEISEANLPDKLVPLFEAIQHKAAQREVIVFTDSLPQNHVWKTSEDISIIDSLPPGPQIEHYYRANLWKSLEQKQIKVIGLEPEFVRGKLDGTGATQGYFYASLPDVQNPQLRDAWATSQGVQVRHQHWLQTVQQQRAAHPNALFVFYTKAQHAWYNHPLSFAKDVTGKNFVIEVLIKDGREKWDFFDRQMGLGRFPDNLKWSKELGQKAGFDMRIKFDEP